MERGNHYRVRIIPAAGRGSREKAESIVSSYPGIWSGTVLDVGCRDQALRQALKGQPVRYVGLDLHPPADVLADVDDGIPLADGEAAVVVALDVLEHTNGIHHAFDELCRVARDHIVIALPNAFEIQSRWATVRDVPGAENTACRSSLRRIAIGGCSRSRRHGPSAAIAVTRRVGGWSTRP
jgi:Methyltransferase domain